MPAKDIMTSPLGETHEGAWPYLQGLDQFLTHGTYETYAASAPYRMVRAGKSGESHVFPIQDDNLTAGLPLRRSILQSTLRQKYRSTGKHNPQRDSGSEKGLYRLHPIALANACLYGIPEHEICYAMDR
jgi:hypothetical protein